MFDIWIMLLCFSIILITGLGTYILKMKEKKQIHYAFLSTILSMFIWIVGETISYLLNYSIMIFVYIFFIGVCFAPISILYTGLIFTHTKIRFNWKYLLLFIFPIIDLIIIFTNNYHHMFIIKISRYNDATQYGSLYTVHTFVSYLYILVGMWHLLKFSIRNTGFFSKQSFLIILGILVPFMSNIIEQFRLAHVPLIITSTLFSFSILCFFLAIFKYDFLNVVPIALQKVVDHISDSFVVIDEKYNIIDFNKTFYKTFKELIKIKRSINLFNKIADNTQAGIDKDAFADIIKRSKEEKKTITLEQTIYYPNYNKTFNIDITPIFNHDRSVGTIILLKI